MIIRTQFFKIMADTGNILGVFLLFSIAMFTLPILTFFAIRNVLENEFHITGFTNTAWYVPIFV